MSWSNGSRLSPGSRTFLFGRPPSGDQKSAEHQIDVLRDDCRRFGWVVAGEFKCQATSGHLVAVQTAYVDMMAAAEAGGADVICAVNLDRIRRGRRAAAARRQALGEVPNGHRAVSDAGNRDSSASGQGQRKKRAKRVEIDPADAAVVCRIYRKYAAGLTLGEFIEALGEQTPSNGEASA